MEQDVLHQSLLCLQFGHLQIGQDGICRWSSMHTRNHSRFSPEPPPLIEWPVAKFLQMGYADACWQLHGISRPSPEPRLQTT